MDNFKTKMLQLEYKYSDLTYITKHGSNNVILTAAHTMLQRKKDDTYKLAEPFTKAIALYVAEITNSSILVKNKDTGIDSNNSNSDPFKNMLLDNINNHNLKLVIDLHGARMERNFDVELGNLNNLSCDYATLKELIDAFNEQGILNVESNNIFKGGKITQKVYTETDCEAIQIEINAKYRNIDEPEKLKKICDSLINFINQYTSITNGEK